MYKRQIYLYVFIFQTFVIQDIIEIKEEGFLQNADDSYYCKSEVYTIYAGLLFSDLLIFYFSVLIKIVSDHTKHFGHTKLQRKNF